MANHKTTRRIATATGFALVLAACGSESPGTDTQTSADAQIVGSAAEAVVGGVTGIGVSTADLPDFAEVPAGANAISNMAVNQGGKMGGSVTFETSQTPTDLIAFYRASMERNGLKIGMENQSAQMVQMLGESEDKSKSLMVMIVIDDAGKASLNLVHSRTKS